MKTDSDGEPDEAQGLLDHICCLENDLPSSSSDNERWKRVRLNISGKIFETYMKTLTQKEGSIFNLENIDNYYDHSHKEYYFDRNPKAFESIFTFMQCGILCQPQKVPLKVFVEELQFFGFGERALKIFQTECGTCPRSIKETGEKNRNTILSTIWDVLEYPESSFVAKVITSLSMAVILLAVCLFSIDTLPEIKGTTWALVIKKIEYFCVTWFSIEIVLRFISSPLKCRFFHNIMNVIDIISLVPYYVEMFINVKTSSSIVVVSTMRTLRVARIFNLLKLYRYSRAIRVMAKTLYSSVAELSMLLFFVAIGMMLFSPLLYYFEFKDLNDESGFQSIPHVFWFCVVTTTTVGFGDIVPMSTGGRLATTVLAIASIILISLPIPIIGRNFDTHNKSDNCPENQFVFDPEKSKEVEKQTLLKETAL